MLKLFQGFLKQNKKHLDLCFTTSLARNHIVSRANGGLKKK